MGETGADGPDRTIPAKGLLPRPERRKPDFTPVSHGFGGRIVYEEQAPELPAKVLDRLALAARDASTEFERVVIALGLDPDRYRVEFVSEPLRMDKAPVPRVDDPPEPHRGDSEVADAMRDEAIRSAGSEPEHRP